MINKTDSDNRPAPVGAMTMLMVLLLFPTTSTAFVPLILGAGAAVSAGYSLMKNVVSEDGLVDNLKEAMDATMQNDSAGLTEAWNKIKKKPAKIVLDSVAPWFDAGVKTVEDAGSLIKKGWEKGRNALAINKDEKPDYADAGIADGQPLPPATSYAANRIVATENQRTHEMIADVMDDLESEPLPAERERQAKQDALFEQQLLQGLSQQSETKKQAEADYRESVSEAAVEAEELKRDIEQSRKEFNDFQDKLNQRAAQAFQQEQQRQGVGSGQAKGCPKPCLAEPPAESGVGSGQAKGCPKGYKVKHGRTCFIR